LANKHVQRISDDSENRLQRDLLPVQVAASRTKSCDNSSCLVRMAAAEAAAAAAEAGIV